MTNPFKGPRHLSWLRSDTAIFAAVFIAVLTFTVVTDYINGPADPPAYLLAALGAASTALFGAASSDKSKRDREVSATAARAESKADDALGRTVDSGAARVLAVQERQLVTERAALQAMRDAVEVKEASGIPVVPETLIAIHQLELQTDLLAEDIGARRQQLADEAHAARTRADDTSDTAHRAEAKADDALDQARTSLKRESEWSQHRDHHDQITEEGR